MARIWKIRFLQSGRLYTQFLCILSIPQLAGGSHSFSQTLCRGSCINGRVFINYELLPRILKKRVKPRQYASTQIKLKIPTIIKMKLNPLTFSNNVEPWIIKTNSNRYSTNRILTIFRIVSRNQVSFHLDIINALINFLIERT